MRFASSLVALGLIACGTDVNDPAALPTAQNALPQTMVLDMTDPLLPGQPVTVTISGAPANRSITLVQTDGTVGSGVCPPPLGGECMDITAGSGYNLLPLPLRADANGDASFSGTLPAGIPSPQDWVFQAVALQAGSAFGSNTLERMVGAPDCIDDMAEDDDDATMATAAMAGVTSSGVACWDDAGDWYSFSAVAGDIFSGAIAYDDTTGDVDGNVYDDMGNVLSSADFSFTTPDPFDDFTVGADGTYYIEAFLDLNQDFDFTGTTYDLDFDVVTPMPCPVDVYEPNDDATMAVSLMPGNYPGLGGCYYPGAPVEDRLDWYTVDLLAGETLDLSIFFVDAEADMDLYLFDFAQVNADINTGFLERGFSSSDDEVVQHVAAADGTYWIAVRVFADGGSGIADGNVYDLDIVVTPPAP